jgi:hypothetical protein
MKAVLALLLVAGLSANVSAHEYVRSAAVHRAFLKTTGYPEGRPGWVADHIFPLCAGGKDALENLQWQTIEDARVKDRAEKRLCRQLRVLVDAFNLAWRP